MSTATLAHPALTGVVAAGHQLAEVAGADLWTLSEAELLGLREELERLNGMLAAARLAATREIEVRGAARALGATSTRGWLTAALRMHPGEAARETVLAERVARLPQLFAALAAGTLPAAAAAVIAEADAALAAYATAAERAAAEAILVEQAQLLDHRGLQTLVVHLRHLLDPDHGAAVEREEQTQLARRGFALRAQPDGSARASGWFDKEAAALLRTALDPLTRPRPAGDGGRDPRDHPRRMADALLELVGTAATAAGDPDNDQGPAPVQLVVTMRLADLRRQLDGARARAGRLDLGLPLSAAAVRRLACDARVVPVVLGAAGQPLDVGRSTRTVPAGLRRALAVRDGGCAFPGCGRPIRWTHAHHVRHWVDGGATALDNLVLLCGHHHRTVHHTGWDVTFAPDGHPDFHPPAWIDPHRQPRRHPHPDLALDAQGAGPDPPWS